MSKSSYDEALDILLNSLQDPQDEDNDCYMLSYNQMNVIDRTLKQAQKQEKLSELYKELATLYRDRFDYTNSATEIKRLWGKIKELENDK